MRRAVLPEGVDPTTRESTRSLLNSLFGDRRHLVLGLVLTSILSGFTEAGTLAVVAEVAATLVNGAQRVHASIGPFHIDASIGHLLVIALGLTLIRMALQIPLSILPARIGADVQAGLRRRLLSAFSDASWEAQSADLEGHLQEIMTSQVMSATGGALQASILLTAGFTFLVLMISALTLNVVAALVVLCVAVVLFGALRPLNALGARRARSLSHAQMRYAEGISETNRLAEETHVFGVAGAQRTRIDGLIGRAQELFFKTQLIGRLSPNIYQSLIYVLLVAGLWGLSLAGRAHAGSLGAVVLLLVRASTNGQQVLGAYQSLRQSLPFIERLQDAELRYAASRPPEGERALSSVTELAFEHVSFAYRAGRPVLSDVSFEIERGEVVGIVGPSGAGKSTLVQILLQLRFPDSGRYLVNGVPAGQFKAEDWHRLVAYVPQDPRLIHASAADNIRYFRDLDEEAVQRAAKLARIHDDILGWGDGYDTIIGPRADAVSGGQQQRICLARALAARPEVLVLDEPTSALDPQSEMHIQESLKTLKEDLTLFIVAHRMSTLDICDRVMVVLDGRLVAFDTAALLEVENPYYRSASKLATGDAGETGQPRTWWAKSR